MTKLLRRLPLITAILKMSAQNSIFIYRHREEKFFDDTKSQM